MQRDPLLPADGQRVRLVVGGEAVVTEPTEQPIIARSNSRCPPWHAGSISQLVPLVSIRRLPAHKSPCRRAGGSAGPPT